MSLALGERCACGLGEALPSPREPTPFVGEGRYSVDCAEPPFGFGEAPRARRPRGSPSGRRTACGLRLWRRSARAW